jgi:hypothetical protein
MTPHWNAGDQLSRSAVLTYACESNGTACPTRWSLLSRLKNWEDQDSWREVLYTYWQLIYCDGSAVRGSLTPKPRKWSRRWSSPWRRRWASSKQTVAEAPSKPGCLRSLVGGLRTNSGSVATCRSYTALRTIRRPHSDHDRIPDLERFETDWNSEWESQVLKSALDRVKQKVKPEMFQVFESRSEQRLAGYQSRTTSPHSTSRGFITRSTKYRPR